MTINSCERTNAEGPRFLIDGAFCPRVAAVLADLKARLQARYERCWPGKGALIRAALDEAEAVAWRTAFPHLFLPDLAEESVTRLGASAAGRSLP